MDIKNYKKYIKVDYLIFIIFSVGIIFNYIFVPDYLEKFVNSWVFNEWLINYKGGFVRRGFSGEILYNLSKLGLDHKYFILLTGSISLFHIVLNVFSLINSKNIFYRAFILFNPFGLFYIIQNIEFFFGRRDLFYLNFLIYLGKKERLNFNYFILISTLLILNYGIYIFLFLTIFEAVKSKKDFNRKKLIYFFGFFLAPLNLLLLSLYSNVKDFEKLCDSINYINRNTPLNENNCWGAPNWLNPEYEPNARAFGEILNGFNFYNNFLSWILLFLCLTFSLYLVVEKNKKTFIRFFTFLLPYMFFFFFAQDWGRWVFLIFFIFFINNSYQTNSTYLTKNDNVYLLVITLSNIFINLPTHLFQNIKIFDVRSLNEILFSFFEFTYNLLILPYIMIRYGYDPPIYFS